MKQEVPVAGVDVSKHFSDMCILAPNNDIIGRMKIYHDLTSMERAAPELRRVEEECGFSPVVVIESTSHYHLILFQFFREAGYEVIMVNPIQSGALEEHHRPQGKKRQGGRLQNLHALSAQGAAHLPSSRGQSAGA